MKYRLSLTVDKTIENFQDSLWIKTVNNIEKGIPKKRGLDQRIWEQIGIESLGCFIRLNDRLKLVTK